MRILITGGAGFIGSNLVEHINFRLPDAEVCVLDDFSTGLRSNLEHARCQTVTASVLDDDALAESMFGADSVVHLAALGSVARSISDPRATHEANATGTLRVMEMAKRCSVTNVVVASSSSVYGGNPVMPKSERDWTNPLSPYAASKLASESYALSFAASYGMKVLAFRFFNVFGPRQRADSQYAAVVPRFIEAALAGEPLTIYGDGGQSRDFTYVGSVVDALVSACERGVAHPTPVNLAFGSNTTLNELVKSLGQVVGKELETVFEKVRPGDVRASRADSKTFLQLFPNVESVDLQAALAVAVRHHQEYNRF